MAFQIYKNVGMTPMDNIRGLQLKARMTQNNCFHLIHFNFK